MRRWLLSKRRWRSELWRFMGEEHSKPRILNLESTDTPLQRSMDRIQGRLHLRREKRLYLYFHFNWKHVLQLWMQTTNHSDISSICDLLLVEITDIFIPHYSFCKSLKISYASLLQNYAASSCNLMNLKKYILLYYTFTSIFIVACP